MYPKVVKIPKQSKVIVISDLHGNVKDFEFILQNSHAIERIEKNDKLYLIITGDICDTIRHRNIDKNVPLDGDIQIIEKIIAIKEKLKEKKKQIIYLEGNHDFHILRISKELKNSSGVSLDEYIKAYLKEYGYISLSNNILPYDMIYRVEEKHLDFLRQSTLIAICDNIAITHAGPIRCKSLNDKLLEEIEDLEREKHFWMETQELFESYYFQLLNNRYCLGSYDIEDLRNFLSSIECDILISGHTPIHYLKNFKTDTFWEYCQLYQGLGIINQKQVILASSFGAYNEEKRYLELDLSKKYTTPLEWEEKKEIFEIY